MINGNISFPRFASLAPICLFVFCLSLVGCGQPVGPVSGVVRFSDGEPVKSGSIEFRRDSDQTRFASRIATDGSFQPADQDGRVGLPPGAYDIVVVQIVLTEDLALEMHSHGNTVPRRYADYYTSGLKAEIAEGQMEPIEIIVDIE
ncbi:MAG: carboxypeptidase-like regulatory domain-containing protein [Rubripirellula sp.]|nr:carboxypeptidase-like regulatory domain-containing protein [Rubripirellula sp.]